MSANQNTGIHTGGSLNAGGDINVNIAAKPQDPPPKNVRFKVQKSIRTFTGRKTPLDDLHKVVKEGQIAVLTKASATVLAATGGIGKTETVRKYIEHHAHEYDHIVWIDAESKLISKQQFVQLAMELKISTEFDGKPKEFESLLKEIFNKLLQNAHLLLLVLDNAEAFEDDAHLNLNGIKDLLPTSLSPFCVEPTVIVTSRNQNWNLQNVVQLDVWTEAEVVSYVIGRLELKRTTKNEALALRLGDLFDRLPIAMQSAVAVILQQIKRKKKYGLQNLIEEYENGNRKVLTQNPNEANMRPRQSSIPMLVLWNLSLEKIAQIENGNLAIKILCFMAFLSSTGVPKDFLRSLFPNNCSQDSFEKAIEILQDYSLIGSRNSTSEASKAKVENEDNSTLQILTIHRMVQDATIENLKKTNAGQKTDSIFNKKTFMNDEDVLSELCFRFQNFLTTEDLFNYSHHRELLENLINFANYSTNNVHVKALKNVTAGLAGLDTVDVEKSFPLFKNVFQDTPLQKPMEKILGKLETKYLAKSTSNVGLVQILTESFKQLEEEFSQELGPEFPDLVNFFFTSRDKMIAAAIRDEEKQVEAMAKYRILMHDIQNIQDNKSLQAAKKGFSNVVSCLESSDECLKLLEEMLHEFEDKPDMPKEDITEMKLNISNIKNDLSMKIEPGKVLLQNFEEMVLEIGPLHKGNSDQHVLFLLDELRAQETQLGSEHPSTLLTKSSLALLYDKLGELDKALLLLDVELCERKLGLEHAVTFSTLRTLVSVMGKQRRFKEALYLWKKVLKIEKKALGPNHPYTMATMYNISIMYNNTREYAKAVKVAQDVLLVCEDELREDHQLRINTIKLLEDSEENLKKQNDTLTEFLKLTEADTEIGQKFLDASNWNLQVALDNFFKNSHLNQDNDDSKEQKLPSVMSQQNTRESYQNGKVGNCIELDNTNKEVGPSQSILLQLKQKIQVDADTASIINANDDNNDMATSKMQNLAKTLSLTTLNGNIREDIHANFIRKTSTNKEDALSLLLESTRNMQVAVETLLQLNNEEKIATLETLNLGATLSLPNPYKNNPNDKVMRFIEFTNTNEEVALFLLGDSNWDMEVAFETFLQQGAMNNLATSQMQNLATTSLQSNLNDDNKEDIVVNFTRLANTCKTVARGLLTDVKSSIQDAVKTFSQLNLREQNLAATLLQLTSEKNNENDKVVNFVKLTNTNKIFARTFLKDFNWNVEDAVDTYLKSSLNENIFELEEPNQALFMSQAEFDEMNQYDEVARRIERTQVNQDISRSFLQATSQNVEGDAVIMPRSQKITSIKFRVDDGKVLQGKFYISNTVKDLYRFVNMKRPEFAVCNYVLTSYPNIRLTKMEETLEKANLFHVTLTQKTNQSIN